MAKTDKIFEASSAANLQSLVNTFLSGLTNAIIYKWVPTAAIVPSRLGTVWKLCLTYDTGGAVVATPWLLNILQYPNAADLETAMANYRTTYAGQYISGEQFLAINDDTVIASSMAAIFMRNVTAGASANYQIQS